MKKELIISKREQEILNRYLHQEPKSESDCLGEEETISHTVDFGNGIEMDIKCCGVQYREGESNLAWTEAVLFDNGSQVAVSEVSDEFIGEWILDYEGIEYTAIVREEDSSNQQIAG